MANVKNICKISPQVHCTVSSWCRQFSKTRRRPQNPPWSDSLEQNAAKKFQIEKQFLSRLLPAFLDRNVSGRGWKKLIDSWDVDVDEDDGAAFDDDAYVEGGVEGGQM